VSAGCRLAGYLLGAVVPLQQAKALRTLTIPGLGDDCSLAYLPLLTQLTELRLDTQNEHMYDVGLVVTGKAPLAAMTGLRALSLGDGGRFHLCNFNSMNQATLPPVLPPHLTRLEVHPPHCQSGMFWRHIAACSQLVSLTVRYHSVEAAADHPSWMLCRLAGSLPNLQHFTMGGFSCRPTLPILQGVLGLMAGTQEAQQQQEEQGWDWGDMAAPGLASAFPLTDVVVPPPNMGAFTALQALHCYTNHPCRCCGPHHWHALAGCSSLRQVYGLEAWAVPPAGVKFPGVTDLKLAIVPSVLSATTAVLGAFPALQQLRLVMSVVYTCPLIALQVSPARASEVHAAAHLPEA
jgi:hypothetical protein